MSKEWGKVPTGPATIDHTVLENYKMAPFDYQYNERDLIIYSLGIGFGQDDCMKESTLQNVYDSDENFGIFPSFAVIPPFKCIANVVGLPKLKFNPMMLLHGETEFILHQPSSHVPVEGTMTTNGVVTGVYDKKSGASIEITATSFDSTNPKQVYFTNTMTLFIRGLGGFGGKTGPAVKALIDVGVPKGLKPIGTISYKTSLQQALLYRLSGDTNPLHADPNLAKMGGFNQPILHGLGTLGFSTRGMVSLACYDDRDRVVAVKCRFMKPVFPGQTLKVEVFESSFVEVPDVTQRFEDATKNDGVSSGKMTRYQLVYFRTFVEETGDQVLTAYALLKPLEAKL